VIAQQIGRADGRFDLMTPPPKTLWLPFTSRWTTIALAAGVTPDEAIRRLHEAAEATTAGGGLLVVRSAPPLDLIAPLASDDPALTGSCAPSSAEPINWPFDRTAVREAIVAAVAFVRAQQREPTRTVIRVADTGVVGLGQTPGFQIKFLAVNAQARPGDRTPDRSGFAGAHYGIDADNGGDVTPRAGDPNGGHGTQVANLALGGENFRAEYEAEADLLGLNVARLFTDQYGEGVWVNAATLNSSLTYQPPQADVVNISVGGPKTIPVLETELERLYERRQLVVVASGNDGYLLGVDKNSYPAAYASLPRVRPSMLVVGAHGPLQEGVPARAAFSNYGRNYVDLLAPGCRLPAAFGQSDTLAGTSFAAPLVAFTAGLIRDFLYNPESEDIRNRLWASTRWVSDDDEATRRSAVFSIYPPRCACLTIQCAYAVAR
jgi:subtilisin family serine protease